MVGGGAEETGVDTAERHNEANPGDADPSDLEVALYDRETDIDTSARQAVALRSYVRTPGKATQQAYVQAPSRITCG